MRQSTGFIYFVADGDCVKVGYTIKVSSRLISLQCGNPRRLKLIAVCHGTENDESLYHEQLSAYRILGEWFTSEAALELLSMIEKTKPVWRGKDAFSCPEPRGAIRALIRRRMKKLIRQKLAASK